MTMVSWDMHPNPREDIYCLHITFLGMVDVLIYLNISLNIIKCLFNEKYILTLFLKACINVYIISQKTIFQVVFICLFQRIR